MHSKSRGPDIDNQICVTQVGGSKYDLILIAAARARELYAQHRVSGDSNINYAPVTALMDVQAGRVGREYLLKIRK